MRNEPENQQPNSLGRHSLEDQVRRFLDAAHERGSRYSSAGYPESGSTGLNIRFEALEAAVIELARAVDQERKRSS